jgi:hypothetical protein
VARDGLRSTGYGIFNFAGCIAGGFVALLAGVLKEALGLAAAFQIAAGILCVSGVLLARIRIKAEAGSDGRSATLPDGRGSDRSRDRQGTVFSEH